MTIRVRKLYRENRLISPYGNEGGHVTGYLINLGDALWHRIQLEPRSDLQALLLRIYAREKMRIVLFYGELRAGALYILIASSDGSLVGNILSSLPGRNGYV